LKPYCGVPLLLMKALYGYTFSGKFLYEEQEEFLISFGMKTQSAKCQIPSLVISIHELIFGTGTESGSTMTVRRLI
jgi:hypothetical protein